MPNSSRLALVSGIRVTLPALTARAADGLGGFLDDVREKLAAAAVAGFDETGFRVEGKLHWVHCARTEKYTLVYCHPRRGVEAMKALGVLPGFRGVAVHDAWAPYECATRRSCPDGGERRPSLCRRSGGVKLEAA